MPSTQGFVNLTEMSHDNPPPLLAKSGSRESPHKYESAAEYREHPSLEQNPSNPKHGIATTQAAMRDRIRAWRANMKELAFNRIVPGEAPQNHPSGAAYKFNVSTRMGPRSLSRTVYSDDPALFSAENERGYDEAGKRSQDFNNNLTEHDTESGYEGDFKREEDTGDDGDCVRWDTPKKALGVGRKVMDSDKIDKAVIDKSPTVPGSSPVSLHLFFGLARLLPSFGVAHLTPEQRR